jgi:hypothetical protein
MDRPHRRFPRLHPPLSAGRFFTPNPNKPRQLVLTVYIVLYIHISPNKVFHVEHFASFRPGPTTTRLVDVDGEHLHARSTRTCSAAET